MPQLEREVLGRGERHPRREQPLDRRVARLVEEQHGALERRAARANALDERRASRAR